MKETYHKNNPFKHGMGETKIYRVWSSMKTRCYNKNTHYYHQYGARGIVVCNEWKKDFLEFFNWAVKNGYEEGLQIDRVDNDKDYMPNNCRFVTCQINSQNTRRSKYWCVHGRIFPSSPVASKAIGVSRRTIVDWCEGYESRGKLYPPKNGCYSIRKYKGER